MQESGFTPGSFLGVGKEKEGTYTLPALAAITCVELLAALNPLTEYDGNKISIHLCIKMCILPVADRIPAN